MCGRGVFQGRDEGDETSTPMDVHTSCPNRPPIALSPPYTIGMSKTGFNIFSHLARLCDVCPVVWVAAIKHQCPHVNIRRRDLTPQSATVLNGVFLSVAVHLWMILRRMIILDASGINILERGIEIEMREEKEEERTRSPIRITIPYCLHTHTTIPLPTFPQGPSTILTKRHSLCT